MKQKKSFKIAIGRDTVYGNPFIGAEKLKGATLPYYERWLRCVLRNQNDKAFRVMDGAIKDGLGVYRKMDYPTKEDLFNLAMAIRDGGKPNCPGCRHLSCKENVCHGSILLKVIRELTYNGGFLNEEGPFLDQ